MNVVATDRITRKFLVDTINKIIIMKARREYLPSYVIRLDYFSAGYAKSGQVLIIYRSSRYLVPNRSQTVERQYNHKKPPSSVE